MFPYFIPIIDLRSLEFVEDIIHDFKYAIIPVYKIWDYDHRLILDRLNKVPNVEWILSSVMPDKYLIINENINRVINLAESLNIKSLIVWDLPTYINNLDKSINNVIKSLDIIKKFSKKGFNVIPLVKGAIPSHIRVFAKNVYDEGYRYVAFHISDYLRHSLNPKIYLPEYDDRYKLMVDNIKAILDYDFKEIILLGGASIRHYEDFIDLDERIRVAGYTWYIDGVNKLAYTTNARKRFVDLKFKFIECTCPNCVNRTPLTRRSKESIIRHNLYILKDLIEEKYQYTIHIYDLILNYSEELAIASDPYVGRRDSLWRELIELISHIHPSYFIIIGSIFSDKDPLPLDELNEFIEEIIKLYEEHLTKTIFVPRYMHKEYYVNHVIKRMYPDDIDFYREYLSESKYDNLIKSLYRLLVISKNRFKIRKYYGLDKKLDITIDLYGHQIASLSKIIEELSLIKSNDNTWKIVDYIPRPYINYKNKIASPGVWASELNTYTKPLKGVIYLTREGKIKIIYKN